MWTFSGCFHKNTLIQPTHPHIIKSHTQKTKTQNESMCWELSSAEIAVERNKPLIFLEKATSFFCNQVLDVKS